MNENNRQLSESLKRVKATSRKRAMRIKTLEKFIKENMPISKLKELGIEYK